MTGQIPKYGKHFRRESVEFSPGYASRAYVLKANPKLSIRSDSTSKHWLLYFSYPDGPVTPVGRTFPCMRDAMAFAIRIGDLLAGK